MAMSRMDVCISWYNLRGNDKNNFCATILKVIWPRVCVEIHIDLYDMNVCI